MSAMVASYWVAIFILALQGGREGGSGMSGMCHLGEDQMAWGNTAPAGVLGWGQP